MQAEEHVITSSAGEFSRLAWYFESGPQPRRIFIFLDGEYYVKHMEVPAMLAALCEQGILPPLACLFISHINGEARHHDFTCNPRYAEFVARDALERIRQRSGIAVAKGHLLAGTSLSGLQAAYTSLLFPRVFTHTLCQSGSFWWDAEWLAAHVGSQPKVAGKFWVSVGDKEVDYGISHPPTGLRQEVSQVTATERFVDVLRERGGDVRFHLYQGSHEIRPWKEELPAALQWLLSGRSYQVTRYRPGEEASLWQIYFDTTHQIIGRDYTRAQCLRWAPLSKDMGEWSGRIRARNPFVARMGDQLLGFAELEEDGHIDHFYVHHEWQGRGIGRALYAALYSEAQALKLSELYLESSKTAMPFFARLGFEITKEEEHFICDAPAKRYLMRKDIG